AAGATKPTPPLLPGSDAARALDANTADFPLEMSPTPLSSSSSLSSGMTMRSGTLLGRCAPPCVEKTAPRPVAACSCCCSCMINASARDDVVVVVVVVDLRGSNSGGTAADAVAGVLLLCSGASSVGGRSGNDGGGIDGAAEAPPPPRPSLLAARLQVLGVPGR